LLINDIDRSRTLIFSVPAQPALIENMWRKGRNVKIAALDIYTSRIEACFFCKSGKPTSKKIWLTLLSELALKDQDIFLLDNQVE
jgi:hypothetical protein